MRVLITGGNGNIAKMIKKRLSGEFSIFAPSRSELDVLDFNILNNLVYKLYHLSYEDVLVVDPDFNQRLSKVEYEALIVE